MRASDLLGADVRDRDGRDLGHVRDLRLRQDAPGEWNVVGCIVGRGAVAERLGYAYGTATGPWLLSRIMGVVGRRMRYVSWTQVARIDGRVLHLDVRGEELRHPDHAEVG